jgi:hypothetical protein
MASRKGLKVQEVTDDENNFKSGDDTDKDNATKKCVMF